jgi:TRAP-type C4-dicarboxylate transport system permease small subunit
MSRDATTSVSMIRLVLDRLYLLAGWAAGGFMVLIFILMMVLSAGRPLGINLSAGDDFVAWCMAAMAFLGLAYTFRAGEMIRVGCSSTASPAGRATSSRSPRW